MRLSQATSFRVLPPRVLGKEFARQAFRFYGAPIAFGTSVLQVIVPRVFARFRQRQFRQLFTSSSSSDLQLWQQLSLSEGSPGVSMSLPPFSSSTDLWDSSRFLSFVWFSSHQR